MESADATDSPPAKDDACDEMEMENDVLSSRLSFRRSWRFFVRSCLLE